MNEYTRQGRPPEEPRTLLGVRLRSLRLGKGWTQEQLAKKAGVSRDRIQAYERGPNEPRLFSAICLADALGVTLDYLATGRGTP